MKNHHYQSYSGFAWKTFQMCKNLFTLAYEAKFSEKKLYRNISRTVFIKKQVNKTSEVFDQ